MGREVAIKVIPTAFRADVDRLQRFEHEARAATTFNHPNMLAVHDLGTHDNASFIIESGQIWPSSAQTGRDDARRSAALLR